MNDHEGAADHHRYRWLGTGIVAAVALVATLPTTGDLGLTWDEPAYRYSQLVSVQWWEQTRRGEVDGRPRRSLDADTLLYYWPYGRHGINFHPPLSGQLNLLTNAIFGGLGEGYSCASARFGVRVCHHDYRFVSLPLPEVWRLGWLDVGWGLTDHAPGLWARAPCRDRHPGHDALAPDGGCPLERAERAECRAMAGAVGVLLGLSFLVKMAAVMVLLPILFWLLVATLPRELRRGGRAGWVDAIVTMVAILAPLAVAYLEIRRLAGLLPPPKMTNLFAPGRRADGQGRSCWRLWHSGSFVGCLDGPSRAPRSGGSSGQALEIRSAIVAFAPAIGWLGNPAWWRERCQGWPITTC